MVVSTPAIARTGPIDLIYGGPEIINQRSTPLNDSYSNHGLLYSRYFHIARSNDILILVFLLISTSTRKIKGHEAKILKKLSSIHPRRTLSKGYIFHGKIAIEITVYVQSGFMLYSGQSIGGDAGVQTPVFSARR